MQKFKQLGLLILFVVCCLLFVIFYMIGCGSAVNPATTTTTAASTTTTTGASTTTSTATTTTTTTTTTATATAYSVAGTVVFYEAGQLGIRAAVTIIATNDSFTVVTTADSNTGTFETDCPAGTFTFSAVEPGWTIPAITVVVTDEPVANQDFIANPTSWEVLRVGTEPLKSILRATSMAGAEDYIFAVGGSATGDDGVVLRAASPYGESDWETLNLPNEEVGLLYVYEFDETGLYILDRFANQYGCATAAAATLSYDDLTALDLDGNSFYKVAFAAFSLDDQAVYGFTEKQTKEIIFYDGTNFHTVTTSGGLLGITKHDDSTLLAVGEAGAFYTVDITDPTNPTATAVAFPGTENLTDIVSDSNDSNLGGFIVTESGSVHRFIDPTTYWTEVSGIPYPLKGAFIGGSQENSLICGDGGLIMKHR